MCGVWGDPVQGHLGLQVTFSKPLPAQWRCTSKTDKGLNCRLMLSLTQQQGDTHWIVIDSTGSEEKQECIAADDKLPHTHTLNTFQTP